MIRQVAPWMLALSVAFSAAAEDATPSPSASSWSEWRGPSRDGRVPGDDWPGSLAGLERTWRVELGKGYSGPLVVGDRVFVTETLADGETERARALDRRTGRELWRAEWPGDGHVPFFARSNGDWIRATPVHDGEALYVGGMEEVLLKLDASDGRELWRVDLPERFGVSVPDFGFVCSPLIHGDSLFVQAAHSLVRLDRRTGATIWRTLEGGGEISRSGAFSSPVLATLAGRLQIVVQTREVLAGVDPEAGEVLWSQPVPNFRGMNILTPVVIGDRILTSTYKNRTFLFEVRRDEDDRFAVAELWSHKFQGYMSTPVVVGSHAYLHMANSRVASVDLERGVEGWISKPFGKYWSMVTQVDKILALDAGGELILLRANPQELEVLDRVEVASQPTWGHLAVSDGELFVRELEAVAAYSLGTSSGGSGVLGFAGVAP